MKNSWWTEELSETCIEFYSRNKFEKLVHLVGFIVRIYHVARSPERPIFIYFNICTLHLSLLCPMTNKYTLILHITTVSLCSQHYAKRRLWHSFIHQYSALETGLAGTRAQSCDRYGSGTLHPGQVLGGSLPLLSPPLDFPTFAARCLYVRNDARDPSSERWNCGL